MLEKLPNQVDLGILRSEQRLLTVAGPGEPAVTSMHAQSVGGPGGCAKLLTDWPSEVTGVGPLRKRRHKKPSP